MDNSETLIFDLNQEFDLVNLEADEKFQSIKTAVNELITHDFNQLVQLLYRVDVHEDTLKKELQEHPNTDAAEIIARLLIERQVQKAKAKANFRVDPDNIPANEKW